MRISPISAYTYSARRAGANQVNFGEKLSHSGGLKTKVVEGDKFNLEMSGKFSRLFKVQNCSKENYMSRFVLVPKDEEFADIAIIAIPETTGFADDGSNLEFKTKPGKENTVTKDYAFYYSSRRGYEEMNYIKETSKKAVPAQSVLEKARVESTRGNFDNRHNYTPDQYSKFKFEKFCKKYDVDFANAIVFPTVGKIPNPYRNVPPSLEWLSVD